MSEPTVSVISTFYNDKKMLKIVMDSVLSQDYPNIEHVVADAASTDGSVELLKAYEQKYKAHNKVLIWKSEPDKGVCYGFNKAAEMASGDYRIYASDPYVSSQTISTMVAQIIRTGADVLFGGAVFQKNGKIIRNWSGKGGDWRFGWIAATPTLLLSKKVAEKHLYNDLRYPFAGDYEMQIRIFSDETLKFTSLKQPLVNFIAGGTSNGGLKNKIRSIAECQRILNDRKIPYGLITNILKTIIAFFAYAFASRKQVPEELTIE